MNTAAILADCRAAGITFHVHGGKLRYKGPQGALDSMLPVLRMYKAGLLDFLIAEAGSAAMQENIDERAAIVGEYADTDEARRHAQVLAIRLVQCRTCRHFRPRPAGSSEGTGYCTLDAWPQSSTGDITPLNQGGPPRCASYVAQQWGAHRHVNHSAENGHRKDGVPVAKARPY